MAAVGVSSPRRDSEPKVRGATRYAADASVAGLLHARLVLSHEAHAMIKSIGTEAARALPGVVAVLTADDLPIKATGKGRLFEPLAREEVVYAGQPVALVIADSEALAEDGVELVEVELEPLEPVLELEAAIQPGAPLARVNVRADEARLGSRRRARVGRRRRDRRRRGPFRQRARHGPSGQRRRRRGARGQPRPGAGPVGHPLDVPGLHRAPVSHRLGRARRRARGPQLHPGSVRHARLAGQSVRAPGRADPRPQRAARRRLRRQDDDHRPAGRGRGAGGPPPGVAGPDPQRGHGREQPRRRRDPLARDRRRRRGKPHRDPLAGAGRPRRHRRLRGRVDRLAAGLRSLPVAGPRADLARGGHQPGDVRRLPRARGAAGRVRGRVAAR